MIKNGILNLKKSVETQIFCTNKILGISRNFRNPRFENTDPAPGDILNSGVFHPAENEHSDSGRILILKKPHFEVLKYLMFKLELKNLTKKEKFIFISITILEEIMS